MKPRHWIHGDIVERGEEHENANATAALRHWPDDVIIYCARCDFFEPERMVRAHGRRSESDAALLAHGLREWKRSGLLRSKLHRASQARNVFAR